MFLSEVNGRSDDTFDAGITKISEMLLLKIFA